jgi:hypothetical protein
MKPQTGNLTGIMKHFSIPPTMRKLLLLLSVAIVLASRVPAQTLNWASPVFSDIVDSQGVTLDNSFTFQLGVFNPGFTPEESNTSEWFDNWIKLDEADYDPAIGYFTASIFLKDVQDYATIFAEREAYLWIRNANTPEPGTEWFLGRAGAWVLPQEVLGCCGNNLPVEWSVSDLETTVPDFGSQGGIEGPGVIVNSGTFTLQTATFIPEPGSSVLVMLAAMLAIRRRREY